MSTYTGPATIDCPLSCDVPQGLKVTEVPRPRHNWGDVFLCPNEKDGCDKTLLAKKVEE